MHCSPLKPWYQSRGQRQQNPVPRLLAKKKGCTVSEANIAEFQKAVAPIYAMPEYASYKEWVDKINATK